MRHRSPFPYSWPRPSTSSGKRRYCTFKAASGGYCVFASCFHQRSPKVHLHQACYSQRTTPPATPHAVYTAMNHPLKDHPAARTVEHITTFIFTATDFRRGALGVESEWRHNGQAAQHPWHNTARHAPKARRATDTVSSGAMSSSRRAASSNGTIAPCRTYKNFS